MPNDTASINLVKDSQTPIVDKLLNWTLTIGRLIVIVTEIVAVIAFVYRFSLDEQLTELHSAIKGEQNIVSALRDDESKYRSIQDRIALASAFSDKASRSSQAVEGIANLIPSQIKIDNLLFNKDRINLSINVTSVSSFEDFTNSLKNYNYIKSVSVDNIENKPSVGLSANITTTLK